jgi:hypothetical protein
MTPLDSRRHFLGTLGAFAAGALLLPDRTQGDEIDHREKARVSPEVVLKTLAATCKILVPRDIGSLPGEFSQPSFGSGALIECPTALKEMVGANQMVILTAAHNFSGAPKDAAVTVEFYAWSSGRVALHESLNARILASDRPFKQTDDVAFLVIDLPSDPIRAAELRQRALPVETPFMFTQFAPVASVGFSAGKCTLLDDLRLLDEQPQRRSGKMGLCLSGSVEPGHSGAPLVNEKGAIVGVVSGSHKRRSLEEGGELDFCQRWPSLTLINEIPANITRLTRKHDLQHIPSEVRSSRGRMLGPSSSAILDFAQKVGVEYSESLSAATALSEEAQQLYSHVQSSNLPDQSKAILTAELRQNLATKIETLFAKVGGVPSSIAGQVTNFGR